MKDNNDYNSRRISYNINDDFTRKKWLGLFWKDGTGVAFGGLLLISAVLILFLWGYDITLIGFVAGLIPLVFSIMLLKFARTAKGNRPYIPATITTEFSLVIILTAIVLKFVSEFEVDIVWWFVLSVVALSGVIAGMLLFDVWLIVFPIYKFRTEKSTSFVFLSAKIVGIREKENISYYDDVERKSILYAPEYEYNFNGKNYTSVNQVYSSNVNYKVGDICTVKINPKEPEKVNPVAFNKILWIAIMLWGFFSIPSVIIPISTLLIMVLNYISI